VSHGSQWKFFKFGSSPLIVTKYVAKKSEKNIVSVCESV